MNSSIGVLVMAYGGPDKLADVRPYLLDVRGYRDTPAAVFQEVESRYQQIGGRSPILERTHDQARTLAKALDKLEGEYQTFVGMRHWHPFIKKTITSIIEAGISRIVGLVMAPHFSRMSVGAYFDQVDEAVGASQAELEVAPVPSWKDDPGYLDAVASRIEKALERIPHEARGRVNLVFTAHSLPEKILDWNDPYPHELETTYQALRVRFPENTSHFAYQSAAMTPDPWLGPDAGDLMVDLLQRGRARHFLVVPIGFVSEHVEILYDVDIDFRQRIEAAGGRLERIQMPGADPGMMASLARKIQAAAGERGWL